MVYFFESEVCPVIYGLEEPIKVEIFDGALEIDFSHIVEWIEESRNSRA